MSFDLFAQALVQGILIGGVYALIASGVTLTLGVMRLINFAHGDFLMVAMYLTMVLVSWLNMEPYLAVFLVAPAMFGLGILVYHVLLRHVVTANHLMQAQLTLGVGLLLQNMALAIFTGDLRTVQTGLRSAKFYLGSVVVGLPVLLAFLVSVAFAIGLYLLLQRSRLGRSIRAVAQDPSAASLYGINVGYINRLVFGLSIAAVGVAGALLAPIYVVEPSVGSTFTFTAFIIVVLAGTGNFLAALVGGILIGLSDSFGLMLIPGNSSTILSYLLFALVLLFRPQGLFARRRA